MSDEVELTQREWDRAVGIGKKQTPSKSKKPTKPFTNHKPTYDRLKRVMILLIKTRTMIKIDVEKFIKDRAWFGWYWTGTVFPTDKKPYWCKLRRPQYKWSTAMDVRNFKAYP